MKLFWNGFFLVYLILSLLSCANSENLPAARTSEMSTLPVKLILFFDVYNHTQGFIKSISRDSIAGETFRISISELGVEGVDDRRIVIREGRLGPRVAYSRTGECEFVSPEMDSSYTLYLMNASNGAEYRAVDVWVGIHEGNLQFPRVMKWVREDRDGYEGPETPVEEVVRFLNDALDFSWARYGRFIQVKTKQDADLRIGYGYCRDQYGWHTLKWAGVNPEHCQTLKLKLETFLEEIFELVTCTENIAEEDSARMIADPETGQLNAAGRDLFAYVFIKDVK